MIQPSPESVVLTQDDISPVEEFFRHFNDTSSNNLVMSKDLEKEIELFKRDPEAYTPIDQARFRAALCGSLSQSKHPLLQDPALTEVIGACTEIHQDNEFHKSLEKALVEEI